MRRPNRNSTISPASDPARCPSVNPIAARHHLAVTGPSRPGVPGPRRRSQNAPLPLTRRAFSLPELLVVLGIIAILLGILMPTITRARAAGARVACSAHLADIGRSFQMYLSDSKGHIPLVDAMPLRKPPITSNPSVLETFAPYNKNNVGVWRCPADSPINVDSTFPPAANSFFEAYGLSYEYNSWMNARFGGGMFADALAEGKRPPHLVPPDKFRIFNDFSYFHGKPGKSGNMNFLFADWHVGDIGEALSNTDLQNSP